MEIRVTTDSFPFPNQISIDLMVVYSDKLMLCPLISEKIKFKIHNLEHRKSLFSIFFFTCIIWHPVRMTTRVQATEGFPLDIQSSQSSSRNLRHIRLFWSYPPSRRHLQPEAACCNFEAFITLKFSPPQDILQCLRRILIHKFLSTTVTKPRRHYCRWAHQRWKFFSELKWLSSDYFYILKIVIIS